jgi:hypothetical protein
MCVERCNIYKLSRTDRRHYPSVKPQDHLWRARSRARSQCRSLRPTFKPHPSIVTSLGGGVMGLLRAAIICTCSPNMGGHGMSLIVESSLAISCQINWWGLESPCVDAFGTGLSSSYSTGARIESQFIFMWWYNRRANGDQRVHNRFSWAYNGLVKTKLSPHEWVSAARTAVALVGA